MICKYPRFTHVAAAAFSSSRFRHPLPRHRLSLSHTSPPCLSLLSPPSHCYRDLSNNQFTLTNLLPFNPRQMTRYCDLSGNKPTCIQNSTCPTSTSLRCLPHLSTLSGYSGTDGCGSLPYSEGCTGGGGWRCINNMCVHSANATRSQRRSALLCAGLPRACQ